MLGMLVFISLAQPVITVPPVRIVSSQAQAMKEFDRETDSRCYFNIRSLEQGSGTVKGFCPQGR